MGTRSKMVFGTEPFLLIKHKREIKLKYCLGNGHPTKNFNVFVKEIK